jgi:hypothetical protein
LVCLGLGLPLVRTKAMVKLMDHLPFV